MGLPFRSHDEIAMFVGRGAPHLVANSVPPEIARDEEAMSEALGLFKSHYRRHLAVRTKAYPGIEDALAGLCEAGPKPWVLTNKPGDMARDLTAALGLSAYLGGVVGAGDMPDHKPDPRGLLGVCRDMGTAPEEIWYVGDMPVDIETARAVGCRAAVVAWGYCGEDELLEAGPDRLLRDAGEITRL